MTVYVDNMNAKFRNMTMNHLIADTTEELLEMVDRIGVQRKWIQNEGTTGEHFDISLAKKSKVIANGAVEVSWLQLSCMVRYRDRFGKLPTTPGRAVRWLRKSIKERKNLPKKKFSN